MRCFLGSEGILVRRGHPEEAGAELGEVRWGLRCSQATRAGWNSGLEAGRGQPCCVQGWNPSNGGRQRGSEGGVWAGGIGAQQL